MAPGRYRSPEAFRTALEQRIRATVKGGAINRFRQLLIYDRFLARVFHRFGDRVVVKGGLVLELRLARARATKDVDLRLVGAPGDALDALALAGALDLGDWLSFRIRPDPDMPHIGGPGVVYDGLRFRAESRLARKLYGDPFGVDIGFADVLTVKPDVIEGSSFFGFAGIPPAAFRIYPRETHIAEKLHAYSLPGTISISEGARDPSSLVLGDVNRVELLALAADHREVDRGASSPP